MHLETAKKEIVASFNSESYYPASFQDLSLGVKLRREIPILECQSLPFPSHFPLIAVHRDPIIVFNIKRI